MATPKYKCVLVTKKGPLIRTYKPELVKAGQVFVKTARGGCVYEFRADRSYYVSKPDDAVDDLLDLIPVKLRMPLADVFAYDEAVFWSKQGETP